MKIAGIDTETTGIDPAKGHKLIEVGINMFDYEIGGTPRQIGKTWVRRINPKRSIDQAAQDVHHISLIELKNEPTFDMVAPSIFKLLNHADIVVAHNMDFDLSFLAFEMDAINHKFPDFEPYCTLENGRGATAMGTAPSLEKLCWAMDVPYDASVAHSASYDIDRTMEAYFEGLRRGLFSIPEKILLKAAA